MGWIVGPVFQPNGDWEWWIHSFTGEPGGVIAGVEAFTDSTTVAAIYNGNHQPNFAEAQTSGDPYKRYFVGVRGSGSYWLIGVGG